MMPRTSRTWAVVEKYGYAPGGALAGEAGHPRPERGQHDRRQVRLRSAPRRDVHRVEVRAHRRVGSLVVVAADPDERRVADADAEDEPPGPGLGQRPAAVGHRRRVAGPDVGDPAGDHQPFGGGKVDGAPAEDLLGQALAVPDRAVAEPLHLADELALDRGRLAVERSGEHADPAGIDAVESRQAHGRVASGAAVRAASSQSSQASRPSPVVAETPEHRHRRVEQPDVRLEARPVERQVRRRSILLSSSRSAVSTR